MKTIRIMLNGVDGKLYNDFKAACTKKGLLTMPKAADLFNRIMGDFLLDVSKGLSGDDQETKKTRGVKK